MTCAECIFLGLLNIQRIGYKPVDRVSFGDALHPLCSRRAWLAGTGSIRRAQNRMSPLRAGPDAALAGL
jgi:hypothetical protein